MDIAGLPRVTPSKPNYWSGTPLEAHQTDLPGITREQQDSIIGRGGWPMLEARANRWRLPPLYTVSWRLDPKRDQVVGDIVSFVCPVIGSSRDKTSLKVIAPSGRETWVEWKK
jgi:hypothetical protein